MCSLAATSGDICGEFKLAKLLNNSTAESNENTHTPQLKQTNDVESQKNVLKENLTSKSGTATEQFWENETTSKPVLCLNNFQNCQNETQEKTNGITAEI